MLAVEEGIKRRILNRRISANHDLVSFVPIQWDGGLAPRWAVGDKLIETTQGTDEQPVLVYERGQQEWERLYGDATIKEVTDEEAAEAVQ